MSKYQELAAQGKDAYMAALTEIGWFDLPQNNKEQIAELLSGYEDNEHFVLGLSHLSFDAEGFESADEYKKVLHDMAILAGITLTSTHLDFSFFEEADTLNGEVTTATGNYWFELENLIGWFDPEIVDFMNESVLAGENIEARIFDLPSVDQCVQFVFVPREMYDKAIDNGIIPEDAGYFVEDME
ncbi:MAG: hypothetical protein V4581_14470 [Bacteroidota bacterium]